MTTVAMQFHGSNEEFREFLNFAEATANDIGMTTFSIPEKAMPEAPVDKSWGWRLKERFLG